VASGLASPLSRIEDSFSRIEASVARVESSVSHVRLCVEESVSRVEASVSRVEACVESSVSRVEACVESSADRAVACIEASADRVVASVSSSLAPLPAVVKSAAVEAASQVADQVRRATASACVEAVRDTVPLVPPAISASLSRIESSSAQVAQQLRSTRTLRFSTLALAAAALLVFSASAWHALSPTFSIGDDALITNGPSMGPRIIRVPGHSMPDKPLPRQKLAKDCIEKRGEIALYGGCWREQKLPKGGECIGRELAVEPKTGGCYTIVWADEDVPSSVHGGTP